MAVRIDASLDSFTRTTSLPDAVSSTPFSMMFRFYRVTSTAYGSFFSLVVSGTGLAIFIDANDTNDLAAGLWDGVSATTAATAALTDATWYDVAAVWNDTANTIDIYQALLSDANFTKVTNSGAWAWSGTPTNMYMGNSTYDEWVDCRFHNVKMWSAALTQAELEAERFSLLPKRYTNLHAWYPTFPGTTERAADYSGNGRNWTENGTLTDEQEPPISWGASPYLFPYAASPNHNLSLLGVGG